MQTKHVLLASLVVLAMVSPLAAAQSAVAKCSKNCDAAQANAPAVLPKRGADSVKTLLFGHFEDILNRAPLNTQMPDTQGHERDLNAGFMMPVVDTNAEPVGGQDPNFHFKNNEFIMFSSPGLVEYLDQGWRTHQEPGLATDVNIVGETMTLYWYMSSHAVPGKSSFDDPGRTANVGVMPQVGVYARMETGRFPFGKTSELIAESDGYTPPGQGTKINLISQPGSPDVYEFEVAMKVKKNVIPADHSKNGFIVYINPYQIQNGDAKDKGTQFAQEEWRVRTGKDFPPRVLLEVANPMTTIQSSLSTFDNKLFVRWSFKSAWGSYDMKDLDLNNHGLQGLEVTKGKIDPKAVDFVILKRSVDHDGHFKPVNATWAIDYVKYPLADGEYEISTSIPNLQGSYLLEEKFTFTVSKGIPQVTSIGGAGKAGGAQGGAGSVKSGGTSPGFGAIFGTLTALAAVVAIRSRFDE